VLTSRSSRSRWSISIAVEPVSKTSTSKRPPRASTTERCTMFSELPRHTRALTPYFFSKAAVNTVMSSTATEL
jgi:hypothetical protein